MRKLLRDCLGIWALEVDNTSKLCVAMPTPNRTVIWAVDNMQSDLERLSKFWDVTPLKEQTEQEYHVQDIHTAGNREAFTLIFSNSITLKMNGVLLTPEELIRRLSNKIRGGYRQFMIANRFTGKDEVWDTTIQCEEVKIESFDAHLEKWAKGIEPKEKIDLTNPDVFLDFD